MAYQTDFPFNSSPASVMHIDLNSCFASVEQQANPLLRGNPVAVAAYNAPYGCVLSPSIEAKEWGIKVGMTVREAKSICPILQVKEPDPDKYRFIKRKLNKLLLSYTNNLVSQSIDEFTLYTKGYIESENLKSEAISIKERVKEEVGDYLRVSIGISTNYTLAKLASGLNKPDGLDVIDKTNFLKIYEKVGLKDFSGINHRNEARLNRVGIYSSVDFYKASPQDLKSAFESVLGRYWYTRLRGYEIDDVSFKRGSYGQSYVLPSAMGEKEWLPILGKLIEKGTHRMRDDGYCAKGVRLYLVFQDGSSWHKGESGKERIFDPRDIFKKARSIYKDYAPKKPVKKIAFSCFNLEEGVRQLTAYEDLMKKKDLIQSVDKINSKWGSYTVKSGISLGQEGHAKDAIAFGK